MPDACPQISAAQHTVVPYHAFACGRGAAWLQNHARGPGTHSRKVRLWPATLYGSLKRVIEAGLIEAMVTG